MRLLPLSDKHLELYRQMREEFFLEQGVKDDMTRDTPRAIFFIDHKGQIIGLADLELEEECNPDEDLPEKCVKIHAFYIRPDFRHKNLGFEAFKLIRQWGRDNKAALIETEVSKALDNSNRFLAEQGLELVGSGSRNIWRGFI